MKDLNQDRSTQEKEIKKNRYLIFSLQNEQYGVSLSEIKEVIGLVNTIPIPQVPKYFKGFINLRGKIISVIDLREKLNLDTIDYESKKTSIIILEFTQDVQMGLIVDEVSEVVGFHGDQLESAKNIHGSQEKDFVTNVAKTSDKKLILLLDIKKLIGDKDFQFMKDFASKHHHKITPKEEKKQEIREEKVATEKEKKDTLNSAGSAGEALDSLKKMA